LKKVRRSWSWISRNSTKRSKTPTENWRSSRNDTRRKKRRSWIARGEKRTSCSRSSARKKSSSGSTMPSSTSRTSIWPGRRQVEARRRKRRSDILPSTHYPGL
jgi:hypothetical protein